MKPSHFVTPRTMEDAVFQPWGQAIHYEQPRRFDRPDRIVLWGSLVAAIATVIILVVAA